MSSKPARRATVPKTVEAADESVTFGSSDAPARTLSAAQIATHTGRSVRAVQLWAKDEGCPHTLTKAGRKAQAQLRFNLDEVNTWLDAMGYPRQQQSAKERSDAAGPVEGELLAEFDRVHREAVERLCAQLAGEPDYRARIVMLRARLDHLHKQPSGRSAPEHKIVIEAECKANAELRMLEEHEEAALIRSRTLVPRPEAERAITEAASVVQSALRTLAVSVARELAGVLAPRVGQMLSDEMATQVQRELVEAGLRLGEEELRAAADRVRAAAERLAKQDADQSPAPPPPSPSSPSSTSADLGAAA